MRKSDPIILPDHYFRPEKHDLCQKGKKLLNESMKFLLFCSRF